jgi:hypothetical protein
LPTLPGNVILEDYRTASAAGAGSSGYTVNAANYSGADWVASVNLAIYGIAHGTAIPGPIHSNSQAGTAVTTATVFVPQSLQGVSTGGCLSVPDNVTVEFDSGTFATACAISVTGSNVGIIGVYGETVLQFTGATDGIVYSGTGSPNRNLLRGLTIQTTNASGGAGVNVIGSTTSAPTDMQVEDVIIIGGVLDIGSTGRWSYPIYALNLQFSNFDHVRIWGAYTNAAVYLGGSNRNNFQSLSIFANDATPPLRCIDSEVANFGGMLLGSDNSFHNGGCNGAFTASVIYLSNGATLFDNFQTDLTSSGWTDGASVIATGSSSNLMLIEPVFSQSVLVTSGAALSAYGGYLGAVTISSTSGKYTIVGTNYISLTNNNPSAGCTFDNTTQAGGFDASVGCGYSRMTDDVPDARTNFVWNGIIWMSGSNAGVNFGAPLSAGSGSNVAYLVNQGAGHWQLGSVGGFGVGGILETQNIVADGTATLSGCSYGTKIGGGMAGSFKSGTTGACTVTITPGFVAPNGYECRATDITTKAMLPQSAYTTSTATVSGTTTSGDTVTFNCMAF